jgi:glycosyltransferase involved in cell wall biosynthesis
MQYLPYLRQHGFDSDVSPFFDDRYTAGVLGGGRKAWWRFGMSLATRVGAVARARRYDLVVVHIEFVPYAPMIVERWLASLSTPFILDFDDAFFHAYGQHHLALVRTLFGAKLGALMARAALNVAGNEYLTDYAGRFSTRVATVPTVVDLERYPDAPVPSGRRFAIGWIGSPATTGYLRSVVDELGAFCARRDAEIVAIGAKPFNAPGIPIRWVDWSEDAEVREFARTDVGIMPLPDTEWTQGKCGFKLIQAMACWRPVVASPVGANRRIVEDGISGFFARPGEWGTFLEHLYSNGALRADMGAAGRRIVEREYSLQAWAPRMAALWSQAASGKA